MRVSVLLLLQGEAYSSLTPNQRVRRDPVDPLGECVRARVSEFPDRSGAALPVLDVGLDGGALLLGGVCLPAPVTVVTIAAMKLLEILPVPGLH